MADKLNKHTPDSEELLKRLNTKDSSGLDDFEKEALEGFDSLDNVEEATRLTNSLNQKIDEKYFQKENKKKGFYYLSLAAGLVLVIGLSVFLVNYLGEKKELALSNTITTEQTVNEVAKPTDLAPAPPPAEEPKAEIKEEEKLSQGGKVNNIVVNDEAAKKVSTGTKDNWNSDSRAKSQPDNDGGLTARKIEKEKKPETVNEPAKLAEAKGGDDYKQLEDKSKLQNGPPAGNVTVANPVAATEKNKAKDEEAEMDANEKTVSTKSSSAPANSYGLSDAKAGGKETKKSSTKNDRREDQKSSGGEGVATDDVTTLSQTSNNQSAKGNVPSETKRDESGYVHTTEYNSNVYFKPQDYIKTEISKSEMLKTNVKAFKAELTIDDNGKVKDVKFLTVFAPTCAACEKEVRKILLNMPGWKATPSKKAVKETVSYMDQ